MVYDQAIDFGKGFQSEFHNLGTNLRQNVSVAYSIVRNGQWERKGTHETCVTKHFDKLHRNEATACSIKH
jgi:hypothetical protein